jgi:hypothetical protein
MVSTGYYFVDSDDPAPALWFPNDQTEDTTRDVNFWRKVNRGPRIDADTVWNTPAYINAGIGLAFFRNPALPVQNQGNFFQNGVSFATDSTDDAIAGPIPINLNKPFFFNGIRYDSAYVSTNGVVSLTNRRYNYDVGGNRTLRNGRAYDPNSMDWFVTTIGTENRTHKYAGIGNNGLGDLTLDNFGYFYSVLGGSATTSNWSTLPPNPLAGIRARPTGGTGINNTISPNFKSALIAPFWGDQHLSQFAASRNVPDEHGKVWIKNDPTKNKFIIYFVDAQLVRGVNTRIGAFNLSANTRPGDNNYVSASAQVILNSNDSSVAINYVRFNGGVSNGFQSVTAADVYRWNTLSGVRGFARHSFFNRTGGTTSPEDTARAEYEQYTYYWNFETSQVASYPRTNLRVKFKQWKNTLRVVDIQYRVRQQNPTADDNFTVTVTSSEANNYELLAGEPKIGAIQPVAIIQSLSNDIQGETGVNFQPQDFVFQSRFVIVNKATGRFVYNRLVPVNKTCLEIVDPNWVDCISDVDVRVRYSNVTKTGTNYTATNKVFTGNNTYNNRPRNGLPPYEFVQIFYPPWEPNEFAQDANGKPVNIGRMRAFIISEATDPNTADPFAYKDTWPFDDTTSVELFVMKRLDQFVDDVTEYHIIDNVNMPSVYKWVSINADVQPGEDVSMYPLPPRGSYKADNNQALEITSPVIHMNRLTLADQEPTNGESTMGGGDEIRSFPINLTGRNGAVLSLSVQRNTKRNDWERGFGDGQLVGPEPRSVLNGDIFSPWAGTGSAVSNPGSGRNDRIVVNFARPSNNGISEITNIPTANWRQHPRRRGSGLPSVTDVDALTVFGAGGYMIGFLETDKDSSLSLPVAATGALNALRGNVYDDGIDFEYKKYFVAIPDTFINWQRSGARSFRFRIKVGAINDRKCADCIGDDADDFYVDNVRILFKATETTDIEVASARIIWPYSQVPATQATSIPIRVRLSNNTSSNAPFYLLKTRIFKNYTGNGTDVPVYCRVETIPSHTAGIELDFPMPTFNARLTGPGRYRIEGIATVLGGDLEPRNDTTYSEFVLNFGNSMAYDPVGNTTNNVPEAAGVPGRGLNIEGYASGGNGSNSGPSGGYDAATLGVGIKGGSISGQVAMKFTLLNADTIYGFQAFFGTANQALDDIAWSIFRGNDNTPGTMIGSSLIYRQRGFDDVVNDVVLNQWTTYLLLDNQKKPKPEVLPAGTYWISLSQLGQTGMELGASKSRMGMRTMSVGIPAPIFTVKPVGGPGVHLMAHKEFRTTTAAGNLINSNFFALENSRGSQQWLQFMPSQGNPAYAHLHHFGTLSDNLTLSLTRGTWIPLIRPFMGLKSFSQQVVYQPCADEIPVELAYFDAKPRNEGIEVFWETASEKNADKFIVEKRVNDEASEWGQVSEVKAHGTTNIAQSYKWFDRDVTPATTYQYRLRQVDFDGTQECFTTNIVTVKFDKNLQLAVNFNSPNPFKDNTQINFTLPDNGDTRLEIIDINGNTVKVIAEGNFKAGFNTVNWDGRDATGAELPTGTYIARLTNNNQVETLKMNIVR